MILSRFFSYCASLLLDYVQVDDKEIENLRHELKNVEDVFYTFRRPSYLDTALLQQLCNRYHLPVPTSVFSPRDVHLHQSPAAQTMHLRRRTGMELSLTLSQRYRRQLKQAFQALGRRADSYQTTIAPVAFFAGRGPHPWLERLSLRLDFDFIPLGDFWLALVYALQRSSLKLDLGSPIQLTSQNRRECFNLASRSLYRKEKQVRGAIIQKKDKVQQIVLSGSLIENSLIEHAAATASTPRQSRRHAEKIFKEIRAVTNGKVIASLHLVLRFLFKRLFERIELSGIDQLRSKVADSPVILLPAHRSHADYLLLSFSLYRAGLPLPYIAAGVNLNIFGIGPILRAGGAFFIRRTLEKDRLYKTILGRYLTYLIKQGHMLEFYIEGGRSRSGRSRTPKLGLLKYVIRCLTTAQRKDLLVVPVGVSYEHLPEESAMIRELDGGKKKSESILQVVSSLTLLRKRFGIAHFALGEPISVQDYSKLIGGQSRPSLRHLTESLGLEVAQKMTELAPLAASSLTAAACLLDPRYSPRLSDINRNMLIILQCMTAAGDPNGRSRAQHNLEHFISELEDKGPDIILPGIPLGPRLRNALCSNDIRAGLGRVVQTCTEEKLIEGSAEGITAQTAEGVLKLEYYKNCMMHWVVSPALAALAEANQHFDSDQSLRALHALFCDIFLLPEFDKWAPRVQSLQTELRQTQSTQSAQWTQATYLLLPFFEVFAEALEAARSVRPEGITEEAFFNNLKNRVSLNFGLRTETRATSTLGPGLSYLIRAHILVRNRVSGGKTPILLPGQTSSKAPHSTRDLAHDNGTCTEFIRAQLELVRGFGLTQSEVTDE